MVTLPATGVTDINAVLNGTMDTSAGGFIADFEIGTDTTYGRVPTGKSLHTDSNNPNLTAVSVSPLGLLPNTTYHYRLRNFGGSDVGADMTFTTGPPATPPTVTLPISSNISAMSATLSVKVQSGSSPATILFDYGTDTNYGSTVTYPTIQPTNTITSLFPTLPSAPSNLTQNITGLTPGTTYHWRGRSTNNEGVTTTADQTFTTLPLPTVTTSPATKIGSSWATFNGQRAMPKAAPTTVASRVRRRHHLWRPPLIRPRG